MIGKITPLVEGGGKRRQLFVAHLMGGAVGGLGTGVFLGSLGILLLGVAGGTAQSLAPFVVGGILVLGALFDFGVLAPAIRLPERQTPGYLPCAFGSTWGVFCWGADVGSGLTTRPPFLSAAALPLFALMSGNLVSSVAVMVGFGTARALGVICTAWLARERFPEACTWIGRKKNRFGIAAGAAGLTLLLLLVVVR